MASGATPWKPKKSGREDYREFSARNMLHLVRRDHKTPERKIG